MSSLFPIPAVRAIGSHQSSNAGTHTWLTPPEILTALGTFDLDPCACPDPRPWPTASTHWTREDGPLRRSWHGRVWLNPPFGPKPLVRQFMVRMAEHRNGTALLFARTETEVFFQTVWEQADAILFLKGRPYFHRQNGQRGTSTSGAPVCLIAYGKSDLDQLRNSGLSGRFILL